jgi:hypothetical protein
MMTRLSLECSICSDPRRPPAYEGADRHNHVTDIRLSCWRSLLLSYTSHSGLARGLQPCSQRVIGVGNDARVLWQFVVYAVFKQHVNQPSAEA